MVVMLVSMDVESCTVGGGVVRSLEIDFKSGATM